MRQEEINEFNKKCADFLSMDFEIHSNTWRYKDLIVTQLLFYSDWNWIMEVCISIGMEFVTTNKEKLIQQIYDKLRNMEINS